MGASHACCFYKRLSVKGHRLGVLKLCALTNPLPYGVVILAIAHKVNLNPLFEGLLIGLFLYQLQEVRAQRRVVFQLPLVEPQQDLGFLGQAGPDAQVPAYDL